jgi:hypothetical protein
MNILSTMAEQPQSSRTHIWSMLILPLEIRRNILGYVLFDPTASSLLWLSADDGVHSCPFTSLLCNRQIYEEAVDVLHHVNLEVSTSPTSKHLQSNLQCLHHLNFTRLRQIRYQINPFQYTETITDVWSKILSSSKRIKNGSLKSLRIEFDGTLPRLKPPLYINENDLERGPLNIAIFLQPFCLIHHILDLKISVLGGPLNDPWSNKTALQTFIKCMERDAGNPHNRKEDLYGPVIADTQFELCSTNFIWNLTRFREVTQRLLARLNSDGEAS